VVVVVLGLLMRKAVEDDNENEPNEHEDDGGKTHARRSV
jgi:hypothetical protein